MAVKILIAKIPPESDRPPKVSDLQLAALYITSYISNTPTLTLARFLICPSIQPWHLFRKSKSERVYIFFIFNLFKKDLFKEHFRFSHVNTLFFDFVYLTLTEKLILK